MALKRKISKTDFDALADVLKAEYKADGDNYVLDTDDAAELKTAKDRETAARKDAEKKLREAEARLAELDDEKARASGDVAALDRSYKQKLADAEKRANDAESALASERNDRYVSTEADKIAKRFTVPGLMRKEIAARLKVETSDGATVVRVLDKDGKPSAMSLADLEKEFVDNPDFKGIVIASKATGSADPAKPNGGSAPSFPHNPNAPTDLSKMSAKDMVARLKATDQEA